MRRPAHRDLRARDDGAARIGHRAFDGGRGGLRGRGARPGPGGPRTPASRPTHGSLTRFGITLSSSSADHGRRPRCGCYVTSLVAQCQQNSNKRCAAPIACASVRRTSRRSDDFTAHGTPDRQAGHAGARAGLGHAARGALRADGAQPPAPAVDPGDPRQPGGSVFPVVARAGAALQRRRRDDRPHHPGPGLSALRRLRGRSPRALRPADHALHGGQGGVTGEAQRRRPRRTRPRSRQREPQRPQVDARHRSRRRSWRRRSTARGGSWWSAWISRRRWRGSWPTA